MKRKQPHVCGACVRSIKNRLVTLHAFKKDKNGELHPCVSVCIRMSLVFGRTYSYVTSMLLVC